MSKEAGKIPVGLALQAASELYGYTNEELLGKSTKPEITAIRRIIYYLMVESGRGVAEVRRAMVNRHHTTIIKGVDVVQEDLKQDLSVILMYQELKIRIRVLMEELVESLKQEASVEMPGVPASVREQPDKKLAVSPEEILEVVAKNFNLRPGDLKGSSRKEEVATARFIAYYLIRKFLGLSFKKTALALNRTNHTTVIHAERRVRRDFLSDPVLFNDLACIRKNLIELYSS